MNAKNFIEKSEKKKKQKPTWPIPRNWYEGNLQRLKEFHEKTNKFK